MDEGEEARRKEIRRYVALTAVCVMLAVVASRFFPGAIPFGIFDFLGIKGGLGDWLKSAWPIFAWAIGATAAYSILTKNDRQANQEAEQIFGKGIVRSIIAGVVEEILFRWWIFLGMIVSVQIFNFFFFGFLGFGISEWLYLNIMGPIANFFTLGKMEWILFHPAGWFVGSAVLSANAYFRDGHKYQGPIGWINSWFIGMFMFYLLFQYGLLACIVVHFLYDLFIFLVRYIDRVIERALDG